MESIFDHRASTMIEVDFDRLARIEVHRAGVRFIVPARSKRGENLAGLRSEFSCHRATSLVPSCGTHAANQRSSARRPTGAHSPARWSLHSALWTVHAAHTQSTAQGRARSKAALPKHRYSQSQSVPASQQTRLLSVGAAALAQTHAPRRPARRRKRLKGRRQKGCKKGCKKG